VQVQEDNGGATEGARRRNSHSGQRGDNGQLDDNDNKREIPQDDKTIGFPWRILILPRESRRRRRTWKCVRGVVRASAHKGVNANVAAPLVGR
jgi:hypothetical protein